MKVLVTGATGFIGSVVVEKLLARHHSVQGLARSEAAAEKIRKMGAEAVMGDLLEPEKVAALADRTAGVIHTGVVTGSIGFDPAKAFAADAHFMDAIITKYRGSGRAFITTSGGMAVGILDPGKSHPIVHSEETPFVPADYMRSRVDMELTVMGALTHGIRSMVIRPPHVYGRSGCYAIRILVESARKHGVSAYVGEGANIWSMVHVDDLADLYVLALEKGPAGNLFNSTTSEVTMREVAQAVAHKENVPLASWTFEKACGEWGDVPTTVLAATHRTDATKARVRLGWQPRMPSVDAEIAGGTI